MTTAAELALMPNRQLAELLAAGHAIDPLALAGASYLGRSLGVPPLVRRLTWTWFRKEIVLGDDGRVRGWNVRVEQAPPHDPQLRHGVPWTFGHFEVIALRPGESPASVGDGGLLLDYGLGGNSLVDPTRFVCDPVVAIRAGSVELLLGWTYVRFLGRSVATPSFFTLERQGPVDHVATPTRG